MTTKRKPIRALSDLRHDPKNANQHTPRGASMMEATIREVGFGDSMTVARDGTVLSGNQRLEVVGEIGMDANPIIVESDGSRPVIHVRTDIPSGASKRARKLAIAANRIGEVNYKPDASVLAAEAEAQDLRALFDDDEMEAIRRAASTETSTEESRSDPLPQALQLKPAREYVVVVCQDGEAGAIEWSRLSEALGLRLARRGGYKRESPFDAVAVARVVNAADVLARLK